MGAAASSGSDATPADDLAASFESWVTSGGDRCAAAIAALEAASPALAAALRSADADAVRGALAAPAVADAAEANADTADSVPATKRLKPSENSGAAFVRVVLQKDGNASKVLNFAGYRTVLRLEEVCKPARNALRAAKLELDVSKEKNPAMAVKHAARQEIQDARRQGYFPPPSEGMTVTWRYADGAHQSTADVLYRDNSVLLTSPRPPQLLRAASGLDPRDQERSKESLAAYERSRASLLAVGCVLVDLDNRRGNLDEARTRQTFWRTVIDPLPTTTDSGALLGEAQATALVEAMGGSRAIPRRLVLAAGREKIRGGVLRDGLNRSFRFAADKSAVLDVPQLERLACAVWRAAGLQSWEDVTEEVFLGACADARIPDSDATVAWREACSGILLPFCPSVRGAARRKREPGDVRPGDVEFIDFSSWLLPAVTGLALTTITNGVYRDPAQVFSARDCYVLDLTFERLVFRLREHRINAIMVLNALAFRRDGEDDDEPGRARVAEAVASLLTPDRIATLAVGSAVEYGSGEPVAWVSASVVELAMETMTAKIRVEGEAETKTVGLGALRLVEERPSAAAIVLSIAVRNHRNDIVVQLLASPLMAAPLSFVVGAPDKEVSLRDNARATALDYAISSRNAVAIGLLQKEYVKTWGVWSSVLSIHSAAASDVKTEDMSPRVRSDLYCALRLAPASFNNHLCAWRSLFGYKRDVLHRVLDIITSGDMARVRYLVSQLNTRENGKAALENTLAFAAKLGQADAISCLLEQETVLDITAAARLAIVEGQTDCLERLLRAGPSLFPFLSAYAPGTNISARHLCVVLDAVHLNDEAALDLLRTRGVRMGPFTGFDDDDEPIDWACRLGHTAAARAILRDPSVVQHIVARKSDAISRCCLDGQAETLKLLLESVHISHTHSNSTVDIFNSLTPLQLAVTSNDLKTVELVLEHGGDPNKCHETKKSALAVAASKHNLEICAALLKRGASVKLDHEHTNAVSRLLANSVSGDFSAQETVAVLHLLLTERPNDNLQNHLLQYLKYLVYCPIIKTLLSAGAPVNDRTKNGLTALHLTVYDALTVPDKNDFEILRYNMRTLVLGGADLLAKTTAAATDEDVGYVGGFAVPAGLTPMDVARTCGIESRRDAVVATLTAATAERAL